MWRFIIRHKVFFIAVLSLLLIKMLWVTWACWGNGSPDDEKNDLLQRKNYLVGKIIVEPRQLLNEMPGGLGLQFQGEWALYSCSMLAEALSNMADLYPETKDDAIDTIDSLIQIVKSPELRLYDKVRWNEDPLESLNGDKSHVSYLSHLAWMIGNYRRIGGDNKYKQLHDSVCEAMNRRIQQSPILNIPTYPDEPIYVPDMMVALVALSDYARLNNGKYSSTVKDWICRAKSEWVDDKTGLIVSVLDDNMQMEADKRFLCSTQLLLSNPDRCGICQGTIRQIKDTFPSVLSGYRYQRILRPFVLAWYGYRCRSDNSES